MRTSTVSPDRGRRPPIGSSARLAGLVVLVVAVGLWGVLASRGDEHPSQPEGGQVVHLTDGELLVGRVIDVDISLPLNGPGMAMQKGRNVPRIPPGMRRFEVDLTLVASEGEPLSFSGKRFYVTGDGLADSAPVAVDEGGELVPAGGSLTRTLAFEVPERLRSVVLRVEGEEESVSLRMGPAPAASHGH